MSSISSMKSRRRVQSDQFDPFGAEMNLARLVPAARKRLDTFDDALIEAPSNDEIRELRAAAEEDRALDLKEHRASKQAEHRVADYARRAAERRHRKEVVEAEWLADALSARQRATSEAAQTADIHRKATWISRGLIGVMAVGVVWGSVNVQHNMMAGESMTDPRFWLAFLYEPMIVVPLIFVMVTAATAARRGRPVDKRRVIGLEAGLLLLSLVLNVGPHVMAGHWQTAIDYGIAPIMIAAVVALHSWTSHTFADLIGDESSVEAEVVEVQTTHIDLATVAAAA